MTSEAGTVRTLARKGWLTRLFGLDERPPAGTAPMRPAVAEAGETAPPVENRRASERREAPFGQQDIVRFSVRGRIHESLVHDLSLGGVSFSLPRAEFALLPLGAKLARVTIECGERSFVAALDVRSKRKVRSFLGGAQTQIGCRFVALEPDAQAVLEAILESLERGRH